MKRVSGHTIAGVRIQDIGYGHDLHVVELRVYHIGCHFDEAIHRHGLFETNVRDVLQFGSRFAVEESCCPANFQGTSHKEPPENSVVVIPVLRKRGNSAHLEGVLHPAAVRWQETL